MFYEHLGGASYRLRVKDPSRTGRKWLSKRIEVPVDILRSDRKTKQYLDLELAKFVDSVETGQFVRPERMTFKDFVPIWRKNYAEQEMGKYTIGTYTSIIESRLIPEFGDSRIDQIKPLHLVTFFANLTRLDGRPLATSSKLNIYKAAKSIFDAAYEWKIIANNPIDSVKRPTTDKAEKKRLRQKKKTYNRAEAMDLLIALYDLPDHWRLYYMGCMLGGFRRGELLAIEWSDINYEEAAIWIEKQITFDDKGRKIEGELKTEESEDWVAMPRWYMDELKAFERRWKKERLQCPDWRGGDKQYVFHSGKGESYYPNTPSLTWRRFLKRHGIPHVPLHGLRHTAGMILRESGVDLKTIQERLRHTKLDTTANIYTHESAIINREAADSLEVFNPKKLKTAPKSAPRT